MIIKSFSINYEKLFSDCKVNLIYGENFHLKTEILNIENPNLCKEDHNFKQRQFVFCPKTLNEENDPQW